MNLQEINQKLTFIAASHFDGVDTLKSQGRVAERTTTVITVNSEITQRN